MSIARSELKAQDFRGVITGRQLDTVHPGSVLLADFIEAMGITRYRVAKAIGVQQRRIDEICAGGAASRLTRLCAWAWPSASSPSSG